jgi:hypothetical protein
MKYYFGNAKASIRILLLGICAVFVLLMSGAAYAAAPTLNFSDLINGPRTGNGDGVGSGVIVTIWGNNLGSTQGGSTITVGGVAPAHIYYWKNADGTLPGGPADLYSGHKMQEVCFSLGATTPTGSQNIVVTVGGVASNLLPFTVTSSGSIYFVKPTGNDGAAGTWAAPWLTMTHAFNGAALSAGDTVYFVGSTTSSSQPIRGINGTANNLINFAAYPNSSVVSTGGGVGGSNFLNAASYVTVSKISGSDDTEVIEVMPHSRIIGNAATQNTCANGSAAAIYCWQNECEGSAILGNYIHDFGGDCTSNQEHATYFTGRGGQVFSSPFEVGWNYLKNNIARMGIHIYDEHACFNVHGGPIKLHDNFVVNQVQDCINVGLTNCNAGTGFDSAVVVNIYNNVCIGTGKGHSAGGIGPSDAIWVGWESNAATHNIYNNTIYDYSDSGCAGEVMCTAFYIGWYNIEFTGKVNWRNNLVVDTRGLPYFNVKNGSGGTTGITNVGHNLWYSTVGGLSAPSWDTSPITSNPLLTNPGAGDYSLQSGSPAKDAGITGLAAYDILGISRPQGASYDIGAFEYNTGSPPPTTHAVTPSAGANGSISPNTTQTVVDGNSATFTVTPNANYTASMGGTCGGSLSGTSYITNSITADCTVTATFTAVPTYTIGGSITNLAGTISLTDTNAGTASVSSSSFVLPNHLATGTPYNVTIAAQPASRFCTVSNGSGTINGANVTNVSVSCATTYTVGGTLSGFSGNGTVTIQNNGSDTLHLSGNGAFTFTSRLLNGSAYLVTVTGQPTGQTCTVSNEAGNISGANITNITMSCVNTGPTSKTPSTVGSVGVQ